MLKIYKQKKETYIFLNITKNNMHANYINRKANNRIIIRFQK